MTKEDIDAHNAKVREFWAEYTPLIDAITMEQAEEIVRLGQEEGRSMNRIAILMRDKLTFEWPERFAVAIGTALFTRALTMLDRYDPEFRPEPSRDFVQKVEDADVFYLPHKHQFEIVLGENSEFVRASYIPKFGMDVEDANHIAEIVRKYRAQISPEQSERLSG